MPQTIAFARRSSPQNPRVPSIQSQKASIMREGTYRLLGTPSITTPHRTIAFTTAVVIVQCAVRLSRHKGTSSSPSLDDEVPFSNKNDTVPPGTSFTVRSWIVPSREMLSRSTASSSDDMRLFVELPTGSTCCPCEDDERNNKLRRMSSCTRSLASGRRQLI
jgi:hypothetical protein